MSAEEPGGERSAEEFARNRQLEDLLAELNSDLWPAEEALLQGTKAAQPYPLILIVGAPRSGTTVFMQWLANTGVAAYPTNLLSRFYGAPILGAKIQRLLTDPEFDYRNELGEFIQNPDYRSENGKTQGALAPNEFWYFWRRFTPDSKTQLWTDGQLKRDVDAIRLTQELAGVMNVLGKPFAAKAMLFNYNISFLDEIFDNVIFVHIKRDEADNAESLLSARRRQLGSEDTWYSFQVPEYESLKGRSPSEQVIGQIRSIDRAVYRGLERVAEGRKIVVPYENFCKSPKRVFDDLVARLSQQGMNEATPYSGPCSFEVSRKTQIRRDILEAQMAPFDFYGSD